MEISFRYIVIILFLLSLIFTNIIYAEESNDTNINKKEFEEFKPKEEILKDKNLSFPRDIW